jgi:hypothetical protein
MKKGQLNSDAMLFLGVAAVLIVGAVATGLIKIPDFTGGAGGSGVFIPSPSSACVNEGEPYYYTCSNGVQIISHMCSQGAWKRTTSQCEQGFIPTATPFIPSVPAGTPTPHVYAACPENVLLAQLYAQTGAQACNCKGSNVLTMSSFYCCASGLSAVPCGQATPTPTPCNAGASCTTDLGNAGKRVAGRDAAGNPTCFCYAVNQITPTPTPYVFAREGELCGYMSGKDCGSGLRCSWVNFLMVCVKVGSPSTPVPTAQPCPTGQSCVTLSGNAGTWVYGGSPYPTCSCYAVGQQNGNNCIGVSQTCQPVINDKCCVGSCGFTWSGFTCH